MFVQSVISSFGYLGGVAGEAVFIDTEVPWLIEWETATTCIQHLHLLSGEDEVGDNRWHCFPFSNDLGGLALPTWFLNGSPTNDQPHKKIRVAVILTNQIATKID